MAITRWIVALASSAEIKVDDAVNFYLWVGWVLRRNRNTYENTRKALSNDHDLRCVDYYEFFFLVSSKVRLLCSPYFFLSPRRTLPQQNNFLLNWKLILHDFLDLLYLTLSLYSQFVNKKPKIKDLFYLWLIQPFPLVELRRTILTLQPHSPFPSTCK